MVLKELEEIPAVDTIRVEVEQIPVIPVVEVKNLVREIIKTPSTNEIDSSVTGFVSNFDISNLEVDSYRVFLALVKKKHTEVIFDNLDFSKIELNSSNQFLFKLFNEIIKAGFAQQVIEKLLNIDVSTEISEEVISLFENLISEGQSEQVINKLGLKEQSLNDLPPTLLRILRVLINSRQAEVVYEKLNVKSVDLSSVSNEVVKLIVYFVYAGMSETILEEINFGLLDLNKINKSQLELLNTIVAINPELVSTLLVKLNLEKVNLNLLNESLKIFLELILSNGENSGVFKRINFEQVDFNIKHTNEVLLFDFILFLIEKGIISDKEMLSLKKFERKKFNYNDLINDNQENNDVSSGWPNLERQKKSIVVDQDTKEILRGGWVSYQLYKSVEQDKEPSTSKVYLLMEGKEIKSVIFRNDNIDKKHLAAYQRAVQVIPEFVATAVYPELLDLDTDRKKISKIYFYNNRKKSGFREVYGGPSIRNVDWDNVSGVIEEEVNRQISYILLTLKSHKINHNHSHDGNFNVRFLLDDGKSKQVVFDLTQAIEMMKNNRDFSLTPIVTLRDWDDGELLQ